jgi:hypothetical protein
MPETIAEKIAAGGESKLDKESKDKIAYCNAIVEQQAAALSEAERSLKKLDKGETLSQLDKRKLRTVVGLSVEEIDQLHAEEENPERLESVLRTPVAYFYVKGSDDSMLKVLIEHGKEVQLIPDTHDDYD